jgi:hypothetical protein
MTPVLASAQHSQLHLPPRALVNYSDTSDKVSGIMNSWVDLSESSQRHKSRLRILPEPLQPQPLHAFTLLHPMQTRIAGERRHKFCPSQVRSLSR